MKGAQQTVENLSLSVRNLQEQLVLPDAWWSLTTSWAEKLHEEHELVERVRQALLGGKRQFRMAM